jgi:hypothetical protein
MSIINHPNLVTSRWWQVGFDYIASIKSQSFLAGLMVNLDPPFLSRQILCWSRSFRIFFSLSLRLAEISSGRFGLPQRDASLNFLKRMDYLFSGNNYDGQKNVLQQPADEALN